MNQNREMVTNNDITYFAKTHFRNTQKIFGIKQ
ncbi:MAG: hypothetical protein JWO03_3495, partial [Bacteroidetes bacterium]|nr:hypothetical protein [Bacteroidota bacterium]